MKYLAIKNKILLNNFLLNDKHSSFLQSWEWGELNRSDGREVLRYALYNKDSIIFAWQLLYISLPFGRGYIYAPRVNFNPLNKKEFSFLLAQTEIMAKEKNIIFLRLEPIFALPESINVKRVLDVQPSLTTVLDLRPKEEEILQAMRQKTRYNIRLAKKRGVKIRIGGKKDFDIFWQLMQQTALRDGFRLHKKNHYRQMLNLSFVELLIADYCNNTIAAILVSFFGKTAVYLHGASGNHNRNVMAPYLLQWHAIKEAKRRGCQYYDFYGIHKKKWPGVTRFKVGFGGQEYKYPGTYDLIFKKREYIAYKLARNARRMF